jgi:hypothetical protein
MQDLLNHPAVQGGIAPFVAGLIVALIFAPARLAGLAAIAGFAVTVWMVGGFSFTPLTATRKIILVSLVAAGTGVCADLAFKPTRASGAVLGILFGAGAAWVFWTVLSQKPMQEGLALGAGVCVLVAWLVAACHMLRDAPVRAGAAGLTLGLGVGIAAVLAASASFGQYGMAVGAACGGLLLVQMIRGRSAAAGATLTVAVGTTLGLVAGGAFMLAELPWIALPVLALVPLAVRIPLPSGLPVWGEAVLASVLGGIPAAAACFLVWQSSRGSAG